MTMKVKCINDDFSKVRDELIRESNGLPLSFPVKGELYTIRELISITQLLFRCMMRIL